MSGNELQYGLIGLGVIAIAALVIYNVWQERKARKHAEQAFRSTHHDVLLEGEPEAPVPPAPGGRMEPGLRADPPAGEDAAPPVAPRPASVHLRQSEPVLPRELRAVDCVVMIEAPAGVSASAIFTTQLEALAGSTRRIAWYGWADFENAWFPLDARTPGSLNRACVTLQLVDRRGAINERELDRFYDRLGRVCEQFLCVPRLPSKAEVLERAREIEAFCFEVDIQIAFNVRSESSVFVGSRVRAIAESAGLTLGSDGAFHAIDEAGQHMFLLANQEATPFSAEQARHLQTHGLSLVLDVPRVTQPASVLERMYQFAQQLATSLGGQIVDDNQAPLGDRSVAVIRDQISQFEDGMVRQGIPAGSPVAQRLFD
ncbi:MAG: cell division protein ZipA C-terminal FtsZ-binding domain-containing protein [Candidatus Dactylopiibacterium sp.]|nr:cell division protein ZipA C-terminal FtsZ-binding domain-containing protein [Candidatus Dactylopiibacterium sp.]